MKHGLVLFTLLLIAPAASYAQGYCPPSGGVGGSIVRSLLEAVTSPLDDHGLSHLKVHTAVSLIDGGDEPQCQRVYGWMASTFGWPEGTHVVDTYRVSFWRVGTYTVVVTHLVEGALGHALTGIDILNSNEQPVLRIAF